MKKITFLGLCTITTILTSCSTSHDQFKYISPPPTQQDLNSNNPDLKQSKKVTSEQNSKNNRDTSIKE